MWIRIAIEASEFKCLNYDLSSISVKPKDSNVFDPRSTFAILTHKYSHKMTVMQDCYTQNDFYNGYDQS